MGSAGPPWPGSDEDESDVPKSDAGDVSHPFLTFDLLVGPVLGNFFRVGKSVSLKKSHITGPDAPRSLVAAPE